MRILILIPLLLQLGCSTVTTTPDGLQVKEWFNAKSPFPQEDLDRARVMFVRETHKRFGDGHIAEKVSRGLTVEFRERINYRDENGQIHLAAGQIATSNRLLLAINDPETGLPYTVEKSAYWHELTHLVLEAEFGNRDYNHEDAGGQWTAARTRLIEDLRVMWGEENESGAKSGIGMRRVRREPSVGYLRQPERHRPVSRVSAYGCGKGQEVLAPEQ